jgi:YidC/Oxa1 family membrane protein insertase
LILIGWQYFYVVPQMEKQQAAQRAQQQAAQTTMPNATQPAGSTTAPQPGATVPGRAPAALPANRDAAVATSPRVKIDTTRLSGSIALKGGRIDDLSLSQYRVTVQPSSPAITLLSPSGAPNPYYAEFGWVAASGTTVKVPDASTEWKQEGSGALTATTPVTLTYDNGEGLSFRRTIAVDDRYLFTVKDDVVNSTSAPVTLYPFALISRHGTPHIEGFYILHEGMIGVLGDQGLKEETYKAIEDKKVATYNVTNGWLGITDKYWATTLLPDTNAKLQASFRFNQTGTQKTYQADYLLDPQTVQPGATGTANARLFAGAKETPLVDAYDKQLNLNRFELLIDWGWFYFITKPMFWAIDWLFRLVGNFGIAILLVTVMIKAIFFPLANKSYASMAKMKMVQPEMMALKERFPDDKMKQQQEMMALYKREKINPVAGCLPILIQIPVFFALYKVLFVTIEMRPDLAPLHVEQIKGLVKKGFYDGIVFHRVIEGFMAQTGCPQGTGTGGSGKKIKAEFNNEPHVRGTVSMARAGDPNSGDSQFFICFDDAGFLNKQYTVWGKVTDGMENVDKIKRGEPVQNPDKIVKAHMALDA